MSLNNLKKLYKQTQEEINVREEEIRIRMTEIHKTNPAIQNLVGQIGAKDQFLKDLDKLMSKQPTDNIVPPKKVGSNGPNKSRRIKQIQKKKTKPVME